MARVDHIDLRTGPDRYYRRAVVALWLLSLGTLLLAVPAVPGWFLLLSLMILSLVWRRTARQPQTDCLRLYFNGVAEWRAEQGTWVPSSRVSKWATVVRVDMPGQARRVLVCAARNHGQDYRRLLVWSRFPPPGSKSDVVGPQQKAGKP